MLKPHPAGAVRVVDVEWHLETNQYGHYVVFNASERAAGALVAALEGADLSVQRWDVSPRPADDGNFYDWFARLRFKGSRADALAKLGSSNSDDRLEFSGCLEARLVDSLVDVLVDGGQCAADLEGCW